MTDYDHEDGDRHIVPEPEEVGAQREDQMSGPNMCVHCLVHFVVLIPSCLRVKVEHLCIVLQRNDHHHGVYQNFEFLVLYRKEHEDQARCRDDNHNGAVQVVGHFLLFDRSI